MPRTKRKDKSRAVLRTGESQRADGTYQFRWTDSNHKRFCVYAKTLDELRYKEEQIKKDKSDGIKTEARYTTVNEVYELWKELKRGLKNNTFENYKYMYETFVRHQIGSKTVSSLKKTYCSWFLLAYLSSTVGLVRCGDSASGTNITCYGISRVIWATLCWHIISACILLGGVPCVCGSVSCLCWSGRWLPYGRSMSRLFRE